MTEQERNLIRELCKRVDSLIEISQAINYTRSCTELICDVCKGKGGIVMGWFMTCPKCKGVGKN